MAGPYKTLGNPVKVDGGDEAETFAPAPRLGADNRRVLIGLLGHSEAEVARWECDGII